jgi:hypothetical protein
VNGFKTVATYCYRNCKYWFGLKHQPGVDRHLLGWRGEFVFTSILSISSTVFFLESEAKV